MHRWWDCTRAVPRGHHPPRGEEAWAPWPRKIAALSSTRLKSAPTMEDTWGPDLRRLRAPMLTAAVEPSSWCSRPEHHRWTLPYASSTSSWLDIAQFYGKTEVISVAARLGLLNPFKIYKCFSIYNFQLIFLSAWLPYLIYFFHGIVTRIFYRKCLHGELAYMVQSCTSILLFLHCCNVPLPLCQGHPTNAFFFIFLRKIRRSIHMCHIYFVILTFTPH